MIQLRYALLTISLGCAFPIAAQTSAPVEKDTLFAGTEKFAQGASSVTQIDMDPETLGRVEGKDGLRARRTVLSVVHTYEYDKPGMYKIEDVEAFRKKLDTGDWHCSVHIRDMKRGESTDVCQKRRADEMTEEAIITVEPRSLTFIHTVRRGDSGHGTGELSLPMEMRLYGPEMQAEAAVMQAEIRAEMAGMRPRLDGLAGSLKGLERPDPEQMRQLKEELKKSFGRADESGAPTPQALPQP